MYRVPDVDEVVAVAKELGIHLAPEEAGLYRKYLLEQLGELDTFVQARLEEPRPPMVSATRAAKSGLPVSCHAQVSRSTSWALSYSIFSKWGTSQTGSVEYL